MTEVRLKYHIATRGRAEKLLKLTYGSRSIDMRALSADSKVRFPADWKARRCDPLTRLHNVLIGKAKEDTLRRCEELGVVNQATMDSRSRDDLVLDGTHSHISGDLFNTVSLSGKKGVGFLKGARECLFLSDGSCILGAQRPVWCRLAPLVLAFEHGGGASSRGVVAVGLDFVALNDMQLLAKARDVDYMTVRETLEMFAEDINSYIYHWRRKHGYVA